MTIRERIESVEKQLGIIPNPELSLEERMQFSEETYEGVMRARQKKKSLFWWQKSK